MNISELKKGDIIGVSSNLTGDFLIIVVEECRDCKELFFGGTTGHENIQKIRLDRHMCYLCYNKSKKEEGENSETSN